MNQNNLTYVQENVKYTGFGEGLYAAIENNIREKKPEFDLVFSTKVDGRPYEATLHFRGSNSTDMYFFNGYTATVQLENGDKRSQSFSIVKGKGYTAKEGHNLLQGQGVRREFTNSKNQTYKKWRELDFENKDERGNFKFINYKDSEFDLNKVIAKYPVAEMDGADREQVLIRSLERGNRQVATIEINGEQKQVFLQVNLKEKDLNFYDDKMVLMNRQEIPLRVVESKVQEMGKEIAQERHEVIAEQKIVQEKTIKPERRNRQRNSNHQKP